MTEPTPKKGKLLQDVVLTETQNWASRSHDELYVAVHNNNDPGRVGQLADEWKSLSSDIDESSQRMSEQLRSTESGWQGEAADAARSAIQQLADWNSDAGATAGTLSERIGTQGRIMEVAKTEMPEPVKGKENLAVALATTYSTGNLAGFMQATADLQIHEAKAADSHERAVQVMTWMENESRNIDQDTPSFEPPPNPVEQMQMLSARQAPLSPKQQGTPMEDAVPAGAPGGPGGVPGGPGGVPGGPGGVPGGPGGVPDSTTAASFNGPGAPGGPGGVPGGPGGVPGGPGGVPGGQMPPLGGVPGGPGGVPGKPGGIDGPTKAMPMPKLGGPGGIDGPTKAMPKLPPLGDGSSPQGTNPQSTNPQSFRPPNLPPIPGGGGDHQYQPQPYGQNVPPVPGGGNWPNNRPGGPGSNNQPGGNQPWRGPGPIPQIPTGGGPGGGPVGTGPGGSGPGGFRGGPVPPVPGLGAGGGGGAGGFGGGGAGGGAGGGSSNMTPGGTSGTGRPGEAGFGGRGMGGAPGTPGAAGAAGMGGPMGGAAGQRGRGEDDNERRAKYVQGGPIVEVPGADLPPPVIGEGKRKKRDKE